MNLLVPRKYEYNFVEQLLAKFIITVQLKLYLTDFTKLDAELNRLFNFKETVLSKEIILFALDNLKIIKRSNNYSIEFNSVINYPNTTTKLITLLQFISYGNASVQGNSILIDVFKELNKNLNSLYKIYRFKGVIA